MADKLFNNFDIFGNRTLFNSNAPDINLGVENVASNQTQLAVPLNINSPYSQIINDDDKLPSSRGSAPPYTISTPGGCARISPSRKF